MEASRYVMIKQLFFIKFYVFFCKRHSLMNRLCYKNLFQVMQHENFETRVVFI